MRTEIAWSELEPIVQGLLELVDEPGATMGTVGAVSIYPNTIHVTLTGGMGRPERMISYRIDRDEEGVVPF